MTPCTAANRHHTIYSHSIHYFANQFHNTQLNTDLNCASELSHTQQEFPLNTTSEQPDHTTLVIAHTDRVKNVDTQVAQINGVDQWILLHCIIVTVFLLLSEYNIHNKNDNQPEHNDSTTITAFYNIHNKNDNQPEHNDSTTITAFYNIHNKNDNQPEHNDSTTITAFYL